MAALLAWAALALGRPLLRAGDGLRAQYYANAEWAGRPAFTVADREASDGQMRRRWNGAPPEQFSVRWTGYLTVSHDGLYTFATASDDGSRLFVGGQLVVDNGGAHARVRQSGSDRLRRGAHPIRLEYVQYGGDAVLEVTWAPEGGAEAPIPSWRLSQQGAGIGTVMAARAADQAIAACRPLAIVAGAWLALALLWQGAGRRPLQRHAAGAARPSRSRAAFALSCLVIAAILVLPWPRGGLLRAVAVTVKEYQIRPLAALRDPQAFQANLRTPGAGEAETIPAEALAVRALLERHGLARYRLSPALTNDSWVLQQTVATAWPRRLEPDAAVVFLRAGEEVPAGCAAADGQGEVTLARCP